MEAKTAIVAHDMGAANQILHWLIAGDISVSNSVFCFAGPAEQGLRKHFPDVENLTYEQLWQQSIALLICGSGWASELEFKAIEKGQNLGVSTVVVLDHWVNFRSRLCRNSQQLIPQLVWVSDALALEIAREEFPSAHVVQQPNRYLLSQLEEIESYQQEKLEPLDVLYLGEPIREAWPGDQAPEVQVMSYFVDNLDKLEIKVKDKVNILVRPHPSQSFTSYNGWQCRWPEVDLRIATLEESLSQQIASANWVVGCHSFALTVALAAGKRVASVLPPYGASCVLPHAGIVKLSELVG